jgi:hypothetical protein
LLLVLGLILICIIGGLLYSNHSQALEVNDLSQANAQQKTAELEKQRQIDAVNEKNKNYRNKWKDFISFGDVRPSFGDFGGCDPFAVPIRNTTDEMIDEVDVELKYIKANGGVFKVEKVVITNIPPQYEKAVRGPGSPRGTSLQYEITGIISHGLHFCYPRNNGNPEDPYLCN